MEDLKFKHLLVTLFRQSVQLICQETSFEALQMQTIIGKANKLASLNACIQLVRFAHIIKVIKYNSPRQYVRKFRELKAYNNWIQIYVQKLIIKPSKANLNNRVSRK